MAITREYTVYKVLPKPVINNQLRFDVQHIREAYRLIDLYLHRQTMRMPFFRSDGTPMILVAPISDQFGSALPIEQEPVDPGDLGLLGVGVGVGAEVVAGGVVGGGQPVV